MIKSTYKIRATNEYKTRSELIDSDYKILTFNELVSYKGLNPKTAGKSPRRRIRNLTSVYYYPILSDIAKEAKFTNPLDDLASSKSLTEKYVKHFLALNHIIP